MSERRLDEISGVLIRCYVMTPARTITALARSIRSATSKRENAAFTIPSYWPATIRALD
jgi:hypothetical protein